MRRDEENLRFYANVAERDWSCHLAPSGECKRNIVARIGGLIDFVAPGFQTCTAVVLFPLR